MSEKGLSPCGLSPGESPYVLNYKGDTSLPGDLPILLVLLEPLDPTCDLRVVLMIPSLRSLYISVLNLDVNLESGDADCLDFLLYLKPLCVLTFILKALLSLIY